MKARIHEKGFTLVEGIIATGVISSALIVGLTLAISNLFAASANSDRIIAVNLAREGIEVIRNVRDSNWLRRDANIDKNPVFDPDTDFYSWYDFDNEWPNNCTSDCGANYFDIILDTALPSGNHIYSLRAVPASITLPDTLLCINDSEPLNASCRVQKDSSGIYYQSTTVDGDLTQFYRRIILKPICRDGGEPFIDFDAANPVGMNCLQDYDGDTLTNDSDDLVGVLVTSHVIWKRGEKILDVKAKERLYNWRNL